MSFLKRNRCLTRGSVLGGKKRQTNGEKPKIGRETMSISGTPPVWRVRRSSRCFSDRDQLILSRTAKRKVEMEGKES